MDLASCPNCDEFLERTDRCLKCGWHRAINSDCQPIPISEEEKERIVEAMIHADIDKLGDMRKAV